MPTETGVGEEAAGEHAFLTCFPKGPAAPFSEGKGVRDVWERGLRGVDHHGGDMQF